MFIVMKAGREVDRAKCITVIGSMNYFLHDMCLAAEQWPIFSFLFCYLLLLAFSLRLIPFQFLLLSLQTIPFSKQSLFYLFISHLFAGKKKFFFVLLLLIRY